MTKPELTTLEKYISELEANGMAKNTIVSNVSILQRLERYKPLDIITSDDLKEYFKKLRSEMTESSFSLHQIIIKKFYMNIGKPEMVQWIVKIKPKETLKSDDILTTDDINKLIEATDSHYYKAFIAFIYETGCRYSEAHALKYKDFAETNEGMVVNIPTQKTNAGYRKTIIPFASQYIRNLKVYRSAEDDDIVFHISNWQSNNKLKQIGEKAKITKPVNCHEFRHAQATAMVQLGYNEAIIRKKLGWSQTSSMIARYQHLNDDDVINATISNTGKIPKTAVRTTIKEAEKLTLIDASGQLTKLSEENTDLKEKTEYLERQLDYVTGLVEAMRTAKDMEKEELQDKNQSEAWDQIKNSKNKNK